MKVEPTKITVYSLSAIECCRSIYAPAKEQVKELERLWKKESH